LTTQDESLEVLSVNGLRRIEATDPLEAADVAQHWLAIAAVFLGCEERLAEFAGRRIAGHELEADPARVRGRFGLGPEGSA
jgi:hypothetical protein